MSSPFFAYLSRMKYINRWALMHAARTENLSEHTLEVAIIAHALCVIENVRLGGSLLPGAVVQAALYHDSAEIITGDLPTPVKYHNKVLRDAYKELERSATERLLTMLPEDLRKAYQADLCPTDPGVIRLLKAADKLSALIKCIEESRLGNREFLRAESATRASLESLHCPAAEIFLAEFLPAYSLSLDELESGL